MQLTFILGIKLQKEYFLAKCHWLLSYWSAYFYPLLNWEVFYVYQDLRTEKQDIYLK